MAQRERDMLTVAETAQELGLTVRGVQTRLLRGQIRGELVTPRLWLIPREEVERWKPVGRLKRGPKPREEITAADHARTEAAHDDALEEARRRIRGEAESAPPSE